MYVNVIRYVANCKVAVRYIYVTVLGIFSGLCFQGNIQQQHSLLASFEQAQVNV